MDPVSSLVDRQVAALESQASAVDFLVSVEPFLRVLKSEPRIAVHLEDLQDEAIDRVRVFEDKDAEVVQELVELRKRLVEFAPDLDDSQVPRPEPPADDAAWTFSLACFDSTASATFGRLNYNGDGARSDHLIVILESKVSQIARLPGSEAEAWAIALSNVRERWNHAKRWLNLSMRVSAGLALIRLEEVPRALNPAPTLTHQSESKRARIERLFRLAISPDRRLFVAVDAPNAPDETIRFAEGRVNELRTGLARLAVELSRRIGTIRSRHSMISRFKQRCEWHDAPRLREVAADEALSGGPEDRLTEELARFLFDQGLNPITRPMIAGLQPDVIDPSDTPVFYVEAKQYASSDRKGLIGPLAQIIDTVGRLQSEAYPVSEAFCVVFRRDGPHYILPDVVPLQGYRIYYTLIDIGPASVSGRRQSHRPAEIAVADLLEAATPRSGDGDA